jgi:hypothetical protein
MHVFLNQAQLNILSVKMQKECKSGQKKQKAVQGTEFEEFYEGFADYQRVYSLHKKPSQTNLPR